MYLRRTPSASSDRAAGVVGPTLAQLGGPCLVPVEEALTIARLGEPACGAASMGSRRLPRSWLREASPARP